MDTDSEEYEAFDAVVKQLLTNLPPADRRSYAVERAMAREIDKRLAHEIDRILLIKVPERNRRTRAERILEALVNVYESPELRGARGTKPKWPGLEGLLLFWQLQAQKDSTDSTIVEAARAVKEANSDLWEDQSPENMAARFHEAKRKAEYVLRKLEDRLATEFHESL